GICAALLRRERDGTGGVVDVSLYETALAWMTVPLSDALAGGPAPRRYGSGVSNIVPYQTFDCADGTLLIAAGNDLLLGRLCRVLGEPQLGTDPRFATNGARVTNREALIALLQAAIAPRGLVELAQALEDTGIPCGQVSEVGQVLEDPQLAALGMIG